ncbi:MAG: hypothetical protein JXR19_07460 [Bacteroidia bacterium]
MHTVKTKLFRLDSNVWAYAFRIPNKTAALLDQRVIFRIKSGKEYHGAMLSDGNGGYFVNTNKEMRKLENLKDDEAFEVHLRIDDSEYGIHLPDEMKEALMLDEEGNHYFHQLTIGKQRSLIHIVGLPKSSEIRIKKALVVLNYLTESRGKLDFKALNEAFKQANRNS